MAQSVARYNCIFRFNTDQLRARGHANRVAVTACAGRLLRDIMALERSLTPFAVGRA
ncbi:MAG: hypothetical protein R6X16_08425 [Anaerolineae bacterium]